MILWISDDGRPAAVAADGVPLGHCLDRVIGAFTVHIRFQNSQQLADVQLRKYDDVIDRSQRADELSSIGRREYRTARPLELTHRFIVIDRNDQPIGFRLRTFQITNMANMQQVEAAVGQGNRVPGPAVGS